MIQTVWPVIPTDDITWAECCQSSTFTVSCPSIFIPTFHIDAVQREQMKQKMF